MSSNEICRNVRVKSFSSDRNEAGKHKKPLVITVVTQTETISPVQGRVFKDIYSVISRSFPDSSVFMSLLQPACAKPPCLVST